MRDQKSKTRKHEKAVAARLLRRYAEQRMRTQALPAAAKAANVSEALHELQVYQIELEMQNEALLASRAETEAALERFTHLFDFAPVGYFTLRRDGVIQRANFVGARLIDVPRDKLKQHRFENFVAEESRERFSNYLEDVFIRHARHTCEIELMPTAKHPALIAQVEAMCDEAVEHCLLVVVDITEVKQNEERLKLAASVFTHALEGIIIMDADGIVVDINHSFTKITGLERDEVIGKSALFLGAASQEPDFHVRLWRDLATKGYWYGELMERRADGELFAATLKINAVPDATGGAAHYVALLADVTALKEHQNRLERLAHYDALTGLPNRVLLADRLHHAMVQARRRENFMALVYLDLDGFKAVNDTHGHKTGDELLVIVSQRLKDALREGDTLARLGGDEFVAVLADLSSRPECDTVLSRMLKAASAPVHIGNLELSVSASLGVTLSPQDPGDAEVLLRHADQAMYQAKQSGKNRYHLFDPELDLHARIHRESQNRISLALDRDEFVLHFQPKVNMRTGRVIGAEALIRWLHPERGLLYPDDFLPAAEDHEIIVRVGEWVIESVLAQMSVWQRGGLNLPVSVNIAAYHLQQENFLLRLREQLALYPDVQPRNLELEVIESAALSDIARIAAVITGCQSLGVGVSLDDFGTGYSSLTYLKRLPATTLKIDQSFVRNMLWDKEDLAIVEGVIGLAMAFGRQVIGEGVESGDHARLLLRLGCDMAQGNGISPPLPASAVPGWVARWRPEPQWAGLPDTPLSRENLPLIYAEVDHRQWVRQMESLLVENGDFVPVSGSNQCSFARWYANEGLTSFGHLPEYKTIGPIHERLHALGRELIDEHLAQGAKVFEPGHPPPKGLLALRAMSAELLDHLQILSAAVFRSVTEGRVRETVLVAG